MDYTKQFDEAINGTGEPAAAERQPAQARASGDRTSIGPTTSETNLPRAPLAPLPEIGEVALSGGSKPLASFEEALVALEPSNIAPQPPRASITAPRPTTPLVAPALPQPPIAEDPAARAWEKTDQFGLTNDNTDVPTGTIGRQ